MHRYLRAGLRIAFVDLVQSVSALSPCFACAKFTLRIMHPHILYRRIVGTPLIICTCRNKGKRAVIEVRPVLPSLTAWLAVLFLVSICAILLLALAARSYCPPSRHTLPTHSGRTLTLARVVILSVSMFMTQCIILTQGTMVIIKTQRIIMTRSNNIDTEH